MKELARQEMNAMDGGWGFLCGVGIAVGIGAAISSGGIGIGGGILVAEWACAIDRVAF